MSAVHRPPAVETLAPDLARAIAREEIAIFFQPQVRIERRGGAPDRITGAEALARWDHPMLGPVDADLLFAAAESAGLAPALSDHIHARTLAAAAAWPPVLATLDLSINVTAADVERSGFAASLRQRIAVSGFAPQRLVVEVTETAPITDLPAAAAALSLLRDAGMRIAIDDFGSGYASFAYLKTLPLDRLKIDKSLVDDIAASDRGRAVVRGIVALADALGLGVIAEGVETRAQRDCLAAEGCGAYQGFLCAGALDVASLARLVAA